MKNMYYLDAMTKTIKIASHVRFDKMMVSCSKELPNARVLHLVVHNLPFDDKKIYKPDLKVNCLFEI